MKKITDRNFKNRAKNFIGIKKSQIQDMLMPFHLEMNGNKEAIVEGCKKILLYDDNLVKISLKGMTVNFNGRGLLIKGLSADSLIIQGFISSVEFLA